LSRYGFGRTALAAEVPVAPNEIAASPVPLKELSSVPPLVSRAIPIVAGDVPKLPASRMWPSLSRLTSLAKALTVPLAPE
jgi:hypothetical protein